MEKRTPTRIMEHFQWNNALINIFIIVNINKRFSTGVIKYCTINYFLKTQIFVKDINKHNRIHIELLRIKSSKTFEKIWVIKIDFELLRSIYLTAFLNRRDTSNFPSRRKGGFCRALWKFPLLIIRFLALFLIV